MFPESQQTTGIPSFLFIYLFVFLHKSLLYFITLHVTAQHNFPFKWFDLYFNSLYIVQLIISLSPKISSLLEQSKNKPKKEQSFIFAVEMPAHKFRQSAQP